MRLSHGDFAALEQAIYELNEYRDLEHFRREVPAILLRLIPSEYFFWAEYTIDPGAGEPALTDRVESEPRVTPKLAAQMGRHILEHPFTKYFMAGGNQTALKLSDFLTQNQFRNSGAIYDTHREWGFNYNLSMPINTSPGKAAGVGLCDAKRDFTERDRLLLDLLRRHFDRAHHNAKLATARLAAKPLTNYGLTPRETEIARWLARAKSNPEIAIILGCRPRTIEKHMETILEKLGAANRVAAAIVIAQALAD